MFVIFQVFYAMRIMYKIPGWILFIFAASPLVLSAFFFVKGLEKGSKNTVNKKPVVTHASTAMSWVDTVPIISILAIPFQVIVINTSNTLSSAYWLFAILYVVVAIFAGFIASDYKRPAFWRGLNVLGCVGYIALGLGTWLLGSIAQSGIT